MTSPQHAPAPYLPYPPTKRRFNPWLIRLPILFITGGVLLVALLVLLVMLFWFAYDGKITPGVSAYGVDLGGMTHAEAAAALAAQFTYTDEAMLTFNDGDRYWHVRVDELGFWFNVKETVARAAAVGDGGNVLSTLLEQARIWFKGRSVAPILEYDQNMAVERLTAIANEINHPPIDASLYIENRAIVTIPGQSGRQMDVIATLALLDQAILTLSGDITIPLVIRDIPPSIWSADDAANALYTALSGPLVLTAEGANGELLGPWTISVDQIAALLTIELVRVPNQDAQYTAGIDMSAFEESLNTLAPGLLTLPVNGRFHFNNETKHLEAIQPAVNGRELHIEETLARLQEAVFRSENRVVPVAFRYIEPRYHNTITAAELGISGLVAEATTYYTGSGAERRHNIAEGAARFDGIIIGPGEEFSFNAWLGEVSREAGFLESKVIEGERTVDGVGGGICQVSTTVFRAAFTGGYTIIERNAHAYRVGFYELNNALPGLDAAIWTPDRDFRFQNDTPYHLLIETSVYPANNALQFRFYSTNPGRIVEIRSPVITNAVPPLETRYEVNTALRPGEAIQVDWAAQGADVTIGRIIYDSAGNELRRDEIFTHYLPWRAIIQVPPGDSRLTSPGD